MTQVQVVVVGGGVMGAATAWSLARRGTDVLLLERFEPGHHEGASHGATRNFNTAYSSDHYLDLVLRARELWAELAEQAATPVLDPVGLVNHGGGLAGTARWQAVRDALLARGEHAEWLTADAAHERWPALRFRAAPVGDGRDVLWVPSGARVRAADALAAMHDGVTRHGGTVRFSSRARAVEPLPEGGVRVVTDEEEVTCAVVVLTVGAWTAGLVASSGLDLPLPTLEVTQEQPAHFAVVRPDLLTGDLPGFNHAPDPDDPADAYFRSDVYGMHTPGEGIKAGWHGTGAVLDPDERTYAYEERQMADLRRYAADWLPAADPDRFEEISCTYTSTASTDFVLDRRGDVVVGAGFSGHGYKFAPAVGEVLADLALGVGPGPAAAFRLTGRAEAGARRGYGT